MSTIDPAQRQITGYQPPASGSRPPGRVEARADSVELGYIPSEGQPDMDKLRSAIRQLPKVDLHRHLEGAIRPETIIQIAKKHGIELPSYDPEQLKPYVQVTDKDKTLLDFLKKFDVIGKLFVNKEAITEITEQCIKDASGENVRAMNLRFSPMYMAATSNMDLRDVMDAVIEGVKRGEEKYGVKIELMTIIERQMGPEKGKEIEKLACEYKDKGVVAIDLANDEFHFPPGPYAGVYDQAVKDSVHRGAHAGEALGADSVRSALKDCHAERIGHGVRATEDPELVEEMIQCGVIFEMCPKSNKDTQAVESLKAHPMKKLHDRGARVTINTDDPAVCDTDMNREIERAITEIGCTLEDCMQMNLNAVDALFLPGPIKVALRAEIEEAMKKIVLSPENATRTSSVKRASRKRMHRRKKNQAAGSTATTSAGKKQAGLPATSVGAAGEELKFQPVQGLPHIAIASRNGLQPMDEAERKYIEDQMVRYMHDWPSVTSVITVNQESDKESTLLVESRPDAVSRGPLEGIYEVVTRLAGSSSIKEMGRRFPSELHVVKQLDSEATLHELQLPGAQTASSVGEALLEGGKPNQLENIQKLIDNLPKGQRVAILLAGPSGAGKSSLIEQLKKFAGEKGRNAVDLQGDMYFKDIDDADYPVTPEGAPYWDSLKVVDVVKFKDDIASLIEKGAADVPIYNFTDVRPGGWRKPVKFCGYREEKPRHVEIEKDDILIIDSLHAANEEVVSHLQNMGLPYVTVYLDSEIPEDRLVRRIVRDYEKRGGIPAEKNIEIWEQTTWQGEIDFVRDSILHMDPAQDVFVITKFSSDMGITMDEIKTRAARLNEYGLPPTYETLAAPPEKLGELARALEESLQKVVSGGGADAQKAQKQLENLRAAPKYQK